jgi:predicted nucleic acid-binding Zn ribbon protein
MKYKCTVCSYEFDESQAARENGQISCPACSAPKDKKKARLRSRKWNQEG